MGLPPNLPTAELAKRAGEQHRILLRSELKNLKISHRQLRSHVRAGRWQLTGTRAIAVDLGPLEGDSASWRAVSETGPHAALAGVSALLAAGMTGYDESLIHVWTPKSTRPGHPDGVRVHESRRWTEEDVITAGLRRMEPAVAAVQGALWAKSPRQATLVLVMPVQQRLVSPREIAKQLDRVQRHRFRKVLLAALADIADGAQSLGELDLTTLCRRRGLPEPDRQQVQQTSRGRIYLDARWTRYNVVVEVNGAGHMAVAVQLDDDYRDTELRLMGQLLLRVSTLQLRTDPEPFLDQLTAALRKRGWRG